MIEGGLERGGVYGEERLKKFERMFVLSISCHKQIRPWNDRGYIFALQITPNIP